MSEENQDDKIVQAIQRFLKQVKEALLARPFRSIPEIAQDLDFRGYIDFIQWFKEHENITPLKYRKREMEKIGQPSKNLSKNIQKAQKLLERNPPPFKEVARLCNYSSLRSFLTAFKKATGKTPREYASQFNKATPAKAPEPDHSIKVGLAKILLEQYLSMSVEQIEESLSLQKGELTREFLKRELMTPDKHRNKKIREAGFFIGLPEKLSKAVQLFREDPNAPIKEISSKSGFAHSTNFTKSMKKHFGMTPREYQRLVRERLKEAGILPEITL